MSLKTTTVITLVIIAVCLAAGAIVYGRMPEQVASHWNAQGQADGYSSRLSAMLFLPGIMLAMAVLVLGLPMLDPLRRNIDRFRPTYHAFVVGLMLMLAYLHGLSLAFNLGRPFDMGRALAPAIGAMVFGAGVLIGRARRNFMIGIRTPWTLYSEQVWDRTHRVGSVAFRVAGVVSTLGVLAPSGWAFALVMVPLLAAALYAVVYSYFAYRAESAGERTE